MTGSILEDFAGQGLGRILIQNVAKDLLRRGVRAIEAFGDAQNKPGACLLPADYLLAVGFKTVRPASPLAEAAAGAEEHRHLAGGCRGRVGAPARLDDA